MEDKGNSESLDPDSIWTGFVPSVVLASTLGSVFILVVAFWLIRRKKSIKQTREEKGVIYKPATSKEENISKA